MVGEIIYSPQFLSELDLLAKVLYQQKYFSFIEDVDAYIDKIYDFIESNIDYPISKNSPESFQKFGKNKICLFILSGINDAQLFKHQFF